jgi:hypothetical protein
MQPTLLVLAAGIGSRYGGLKQIEPIGPHGELLIDYSVYDALRAGFGKVVFIIRRDMQKAFQQAISAKFENKIETVYAFQELNDLPSGFTVPPGRIKPWGTGHAVLSAASVVHEPFAVLNADDYYGPSAFRSMAAHLTAARGSEPHYALIGFILRTTLSEFGGVARAICTCNEQQMLTSAKELLKVVRTSAGAEGITPDGLPVTLTGDELVSMNMWGFAPLVFTQFREEFSRFLKLHGREEKAEFLTPQVVNDLLAAGKATVKVFPSEDRWFGVTYREGRETVIASLKEISLRGIYPSPLWKNA